MPENNALHTAADAGNLTEVQAQVGNFDINATGLYEGTALYLAARNGHTEVVKLLLTYNPDVNIPDVSTLKILPGACDMCTKPSFLHLSECIVITRSRYTTFYNSAGYSMLLLVVVIVTDSPDECNHYCHPPVFLITGTPTLTYPHTPATTHTTLSHSHVNIPTHITRPYTKILTSPSPSHAN